MGCASSRAVDAKGPAAAAVPADAHRGSEFSREPEGGLRLLEPSGVDGGDAEQHPQDSPAASAEESLSIKLDRFA